MLVHGHASEPLGVTSGIPKPVGNGIEPFVVCRYQEDFQAHRASIRARGALASTPAAQREDAGSTPALLSSPFRGLSFLYLKKSRSP